MPSRELRGLPGGRKSNRFPQDEVAGKVISLMAKVIASKFLSRGAMNCRCRDDIVNPKALT
jgi:hypothetical protein